LTPGMSACPWGGVKLATHLKHRDHGAQARADDDPGFHGCRYAGEHSSAMAGMASSVTYPQGGGLRHAAIEAELEALQPTLAAASVSRMLTVQLEELFSC
jgi:hypothetical protein